MNSLNYIITCYYKPRYLQRSLKMLSIQSFKDFDVTIVDDSSPYSMEYKKLIREYNGKLDIKYLKTVSNCGPGLARQIALDENNHEYIIFQDDDDFLVNESSINDLFTSIGEDDNVVYGGQLFLNELENSIENELIYLLTGSVIRAEFIRENDIRFNCDLSYCGEDLLFNFMLNKNVLRIGHDLKFLNTPILYHTFGVGQSLSISDKYQVLRQSFIRRVIEYEYCEKIGFLSEQELGFLYASIGIVPFLLNSNSQICFDEICCYLTRALNILRKSDLTKLDVDSYIKQLNAQSDTFELVNKEEILDVIDGNCFNSICTIA